jgi:hypothetical protein
MHCDSKISYKELLRICQTNKDLAKKYIVDLYERYIPIYNDINVLKPLQCLLSFVPLPYSFETSYLHDKDQINKSNNIYTFLGQPGDRIMYGNRRIPNYQTDSIPFTIPITIEDEVNLIQSNVFYYEVTILNTNIRKPWDNECVSIGFGTKNTPYKNHVGWTRDSWGFHSDDGNLMNSNKSIKITESWSVGETVGVGLVYEKKNQYRLLFTKNGIIIDDTKFIKTTEDIYPMIGFDLSSPIFVNWGQKQFKFQLNNYICSNQIINNKNTFLSNSTNIQDYTFIPDENLYKKNSVISFNKNISPSFFTSKLLQVMDHDYKINKILGNDISSNSNLSNNTITLHHPPPLPLFYTLSNMNAPFYDSISQYISEYISHNENGTEHFSSQNTTVAPIISPPIIPINTTVAPIISPPIISTNITVVPTLSPTIVPPFTSSNINSDVSTNEL